MKIADKLKTTDKTLFSFEIVPPLKGNNIEKLYEKLDRLVEFNPLIKQSAALLAPVHIWF